MAKTLLSNAAKKAFGNAGGAAAPKPKTIMQQAAQGHPNWFPGSGSGNSSGVGSAGSALLGPAPPPPGTSAPAPGATTPAPPPAPVSPFWTPAQQAAWTQYNIKYNQQIRDLNQRLIDAQGAHDTRIIAAQHTEAVNQNLANQAAAARGVFQSGIRQTMLSDIDTAYTMTKTALDTTLHSIQLSVNGRIGDLGSDYGIAQGEFNQEGVANAQGVTPTVQTPAAPAAAPAPTAPTSAAHTPTLAKAGTALLGAGVLSGGGGVGQAGSALSNGANSLASGLTKIGSAVAKGADNASKIKPPGSATSGAAASGLYRPPQ